MVTIFVDSRTSNGFVYVVYDNIQNPSGISGLGSLSFIPLNVFKQVEFVFNSLGQHLFMKNEHGNVPYFVNNVRDQLMTIFGWSIKDRNAKNLCYSEALFIMENKPHLNSFIVN